MKRAFPCARAVACAASLFIMGAGASYAQTASPSEVTIPVGDIVATILNSGSQIIVALAAALIAKVAPTYIKAMLTQQLIQQAVNYALGVVEGAAAGKTLTIPVANQVIGTAATYAVTNGPQWLLAWIGPLESKIIARLSAAGALPADGTSVLPGAVLQTRLK